MDNERIKNYEKSINMSYMSLIQTFEYDIKKILNEQDVKNIGIYGMGEEGKVLYWMLKKAGLNIVCVTDTNYEDVVFSDMNIISPQMISEKVDMLIISSSFYCEDIKDSLNISNVTIVSLKQLLENILMCSIYK